MEKVKILRIIAIVLSVISVFLVIWLWLNDLKDYIFAPIMLVLVASLCDKYGKGKN